MATHATFVLWDGTLGGAENLVLRLCRTLRQLDDIEPEMCFLSSGGVLAKRAHAQGVPVSELGWRSGLDSLRSRIGCDRHATERVLVMPGYAPAVVAALRSRCRAVVVVEHGGALLNPGTVGLRRAVGGSICRRVLSGYVDAEVSVSSYMNRIQQGIPHCGSLRMIRNGVDLDEFSVRTWGPDEVARLGSGVVRLRCGGRLIEGKGFRYAIDAVRILVDAGIDATLDVAGGGAHRKALEAHAAVLGVSERVVFRGAVLEMPGFWASGDIAVAPSHPVRESFGMTPVEAAACALPVVAAAASGLAETVDDGITGFLVQPGSGSAIADAVTTYVVNPRLARLHGLAGRQMCDREYSIAGVAQAYAELIRGLGGRR